jgi:hypothetical protein
VGSVLYLYDHVYMSSSCREGFFLRTKMVYTFERMTLNRATTCVEFAFSKLAREMFFVTMEYVNGKVCIFFTVAT